MPALRCLPCRDYAFPLRYVRCVALPVWLPLVITVTRVLLSAVAALFCRCRYTFCVTRLDSAVLLRVAALPFIMPCRYAPHGAALRFRLLALVLYLQL